MRWPIQYVINIIIMIAVWIAIFSAIQWVKASEEWNEWTYKKYNNLINIWFNKEFAKSLINECKLLWNNPVNCIKIWSFIAWAESSMWNRCYRYNCVWMNDGAVGYKSINEWVKAWVWKYNKYWYKQKTPKSFYRDDGIPPVTRYCMGKKKDWVCKEWTKNSWATYKKLDF